MSTVLPAGTYVLTVRDHSAYESGLTVETFPSPIPVHLNIQRYTTQKIEGQISIGESRETMPVSMSVAEFIKDSQGNLVRNENYHSSPDEGGVNKLDPTKPVWVVVHGRINSENSDAIVELARSLSLSGTQIVTVDWSEEARDNIPESVGLQGANWTPAVGKWLAHQLQAAGFSGDNVNIVGPSWGSYVAYFAASEMGQVNSIVALDSAANDLVMNGVRSSGIDFRSVSN